MVNLSLLLTEQFNTLDKIKILHITNLYPTVDNVAYGIFIKEQIDSLKEIGIECNVIFINARTKGKFQYLKIIKKIWQHVESYDLIHCHHTYSAIVTLFFATRSKPIVTSFLCPGGKEGKSNSFYWLKRKIFNYVLSHSTAFIVKDDHSCDFKYPGTGYYIPNGVDLSFFTQMPQQEAFRRLSIKPGKYILFCSSVNHLRQEKRYDIFCETIKILRNEYNQDVEELILSNKPRESVPWYFNSSSVHLLTSDFEGSPNSVKEALACNIPVVSTDVGNVEAMIKGLEGCHIASHNDPHELARLVNDSLNYRRVKGRQRIIDLKLDLKSTAIKLKNIYTNILYEKV